MGEPGLLRRGGSAAGVAASQFAVAGSNYLLLALAARHLDSAGLAVVSSYYLLINTVGRGLFAAVELETTRSVAHAVAAGGDDAGPRRAAVRQTGILLAGAAVLIIACAPLLSPILGSALVALGTLGVGALAMAASYLLRGPLAGRQRYGRYAATFWVEAGAGLVAGLTLAATGVDDPLAWIAVLALSPMVAAAALARSARPADGPVVAVPGRAARDEASGSSATAGLAAGDGPAADSGGPMTSGGGRATGDLDPATSALSPAISDIGPASGVGPSGAGPAGDRPDRAPSDPGSSLRAVLWSAALLLAGQGVWNIAPVLVTARLADEAAIAAGFVTVAVVLRAPVLLFPSVQALLLPRFAALASGGDDTEVRRTTRLLGLLILAGGVVWVALGIFVVPTVAHLVFGATVTPPVWVLAVLAVSTVIGAAAQIGQTHLVAVRRPAAAALAWIAGLAVLVAVGLLAAPPLPAGALGQLAGAAVVLAVLTAVRRPARRTAP